MIRIYNALSTYRANKQLYNTYIYWHTESVSVIVSLTHDHEAKNTNKLILQKRFIQNYILFLFFLFAALFAALFVFFAKSTRRIYKLQGQSIDSAPGENRTGQSTMIVEFSTSLQRSGLILSTKTQQVVALEWMAGWSA